jgi:hypothetical protein
MNINLDENTIGNGYFEGRVADPAPSEVSYASSLANRLPQREFRPLLRDRQYHHTPPTNPSDGARLELWLTTSSANRDLSFNLLKEQVPTS